MGENDLRSYLAENPRMIGVLFTIMLVLSQAGSAAGVLAVGSYGP